MADVQEKSSQLSSGRHFPYKTFMAGAAQAPSPGIDFWLRNLQFACAAPSTAGSPGRAAGSMLHTQPPLPPVAECADPADDGESYAGPAHTTQSGTACMRWGEAVRRLNSFDPRLFPDACAAL